MADTSEVDAALMTLLQNDATLIGILVGGVAWDVAASGATKFCIVSQLDHEDAFNMRNRNLWERIVYLVKATTLGSSGTEVKAAAARIHALLNQSVITPTGYYPSMSVQRVQRVRYTEVDEVTDLRWQHRGGHYEVMVCPR